MVSCGPCSSACVAAKECLDFLSSSKKPLSSGRLAYHAEKTQPFATSTRRTLQRQQTFAPQLELFSRKPHVVTARYRLFLKLDAELIVFDPPFAGSLAPHGSTHHRSIALIEIAPVHVVRQFHAT